MYLIISPIFGVHSNVLLGRQLSNCVLFQFIFVTHKTSLHSCSKDKSFSYTEIINLLINYQ